MKTITYRLAGLLFILAIGLGACKNVDTPPPSPTAVDVGAVQTKAVQTYTVGLTQSAPTETPIPTVTSTQEPTPVPTLTSTPTATNTQAVRPYSDPTGEYIVYYLVDPIESETACTYNSFPFLAFPKVKKTGDYVTDITNALTILFSNKWESYDRFTNPVSESNLRVVGFDVFGTSLQIHLAGTLHRNFYYPMTFEYSKFCLDSQTRDQIFKTVWQFRGLLAENGINDVVVWYYDQLLDDLLLNDLPAKP